MQSLRRSPGLVAAVVFTVGIGIAAVVTMFAVYWTVVLDPVRLPEPERLVTILREKRDPQVPTVLSWPRVQAIRRRQSAFVAVGAYSTEAVSLSGSGTLPRELRGLRVSAGFFEALRAVPAHGRVLAPDDDLPNGPAVCVVSHEAWQSVFGGADLVGRTIRLSGRPTEVVGILAPHLSAPWGDRDIFLPRVFDDSQLTAASVSAGASYLEVVARLAPGRTIALATDELRSISREFARENAGRSDTINEVDVQPLAAIVVANRGPILALLLGAVVIVLLVACANAAALVMNRLASRQREIAVRQALGATRFRVVRQVLAETAAMTLVAGGLGTLVSIVALRAIAATLGGVLPPGAALDGGGPALAAAAVAALCAAALIGVMPAVHATRSSAGGATAFARGVSDSALTHRFRRTLVIAEVALSAFLLVGAALFLTSLERALHSPVGFDAAGLATASVTLPPETYGTGDAQRAFFLDVLERLKQMPQIKGAAIAFGLPFGAGNFVSPYVISGRHIPPPAERRRAGLRIVTEDYWSVMRIRLVAGRFFSDADRAGAHPVCVVNQSFARREFGTGPALGRVVLRGRDADQPFEIVGVVGDVRTDGPRTDAPDELFLPLRQVTRPNAALVVRTDGRPDAAAALLQSAVAGVNRELPIAEFTTMEQALASTVGSERLLAQLTGVFALTALLLASIGLYAVIAHAVAARTVEIGIRMAVGAGRRSIVRLIVSDAMRLVTIGTVWGLLAAAAASRVVAAQLHEVSGRDPVVYALVAGVFAAVGVAASLGPACRATRVDPVVCLSGS